MPQFQNMPQAHDAFGWDSAFSAQEALADNATNDIMGIETFNVMGETNGPDALGSWRHILDDDQRCSDPRPDTSLGGFDMAAAANYNPFTPNITDRSSSFTFAQGSPSVRESISSTTTFRGRRRSRQKDNETPSHAWGWRRKTSEPLSPSAATHTAMVAVDRTIISESLIRIYHDVLENNLACWLAEYTCPYQMDWFRRGTSPLQQFVPEGQIRPEWGVAWSNRMYRRVRQLDNMAQETRLIQLTRAESQAATKALDLVVMAFATQWAQGNRRRSGAAADRFAEFDDGFELNLQYSVWQQAKQALQEVSDLECFRVIYAELVFGLIQSPWTVDTCGASPEDVDFGQGVMAAIAAQITAIMAKDGPPVYLERGTRKIHVMRQRFEAMDVSDSGIDSYSRGGKAQHVFSVEDRRTVGLLYWMAVMFDTVSSSINQRPVVVGDAECEHDHSRGERREATASLILRRKWELDLYAQDTSDNPTPLRWPCSYQDTTRAVARSAAVKVLLFRYVYYLQNALRKGEPGQGIEEIIQATTSVYRYWNRTHGAFFRALTRNFDAIPARIKSWFPCIGIPWHLGALMFADLLEFVDDNNLGLVEAKAERACSSMAKRIRRFSAIDLAEIAGAVAPQPTAQELLQDFHFAVNGSPLLTEPWTILLVRAFTKAAVLHLEQGQEMLEQERSALGRETDDLRDSMARARSCINALTMLGTKSGMAKTLAKVLLRPLRSHDMTATGAVDGASIY